MLVSSQFSHGQGAAPVVNDLRGDDAARERPPQSPRLAPRRAWARSCRPGHESAGAGRLVQASSGASERMRATMKERPTAVHGGCVTHTARVVGPGPVVSTSEGPREHGS